MSQYACSKSFVKIVDDRAGIITNFRSVEWNDAIRVFKQKTDLLKNLQFLNNERWNIKVEIITVYNIISKFQLPNCDQFPNAASVANSNSLNFQQPFTTMAAAAVSMLQSKPSVQNSAPFDRSMLREGAFLSNSVSAPTPAIAPIVKESNACICVENIPNELMKYTVFSIQWLLYYIHCCIMYM